MLFKAILKPIWTYRIQIWGSASTSNIEIIQRYQSTSLRKVTCVPLYVATQVPNNIIIIIKTWQFHQLNHKFLISAKNYFIQIRKTSKQFCFEPIGHYLHYLTDRKEPEFHTLKIDIKKPQKCLV